MKTSASAPASRRAAVPSPDDLVQVAFKVFPPQAVIHANERPLDHRIYRLDGVDVRPGLSVSILALVVLHGEVVGE